MALFDGTGRRKRKKKRRLISLLTVADKFTAVNARVKQAENGADVLIAETALTTSTTNNNSIIQVLLEKTYIKTAKT